MKGIKEAICMIRAEPQYRRDAFVNGLRCAGYEVREHYSQGAPNKVLVIWNRYAQTDDLATRFEQAGGRVIVAENGYMANDRFNRTRYAIAMNAHNGQGYWWFDEKIDRFAELGLEIKPWRDTGEHILVCPNRNFGRPGHIMHPNWPNRIVDELRKYTKRPIRVRTHPGENRPAVPLSEDLKNCWAMVTWYSSAGCDALMAGIPVFMCAPNWVGEAGAFRDLSLIDNPPPESIDRHRALNRVAWAQWHIEEIARGLPFQYLLR